MKSETEGKSAVIARPGVGEQLEDRAVTLSDGRDAKLSELVGKKGMVLYVYPKDSTPGCTREACDFRDSEAKWKRSGFSVIGVSPDSVASHQRFATKQGLRFPLIADTDRSLCRSLGAWGEKKLYGKTVTGVIRSTFVLDTSLKLLQVYSPVRVDGHVEQLLAALP